jgi:hypothetical protein
MKSNFIFKKGLFFSLGLFLFLGASCNNGASTSIPTYQGMTVSSVTTPLQGIQYANDVNQDNPFGDNQQNKIETRINEFLGSDVEDEEFAYFARASETVRVTINILNPDSYVILSFNLNGRRYQSFEFREGSNSTRLLMDVILSPNVGLQELTLDEIKYIDGTETKDAILFGEKTVRVGVLYPNLPEVSVTEKTIGKTSLELDIRVTDVNGLITNAPKPLYAFFYDGSTLKQQELTIGQNTIVFDKLKSQTVYQYAIATLLDVLDGNGHAVRLFIKEAFQTNKFIAMNLSTTKTTLSFDVTVNDAESIGDITKVTLSQNDTLIEEILGQSEGMFENLFTNNTYVVKAYYSYQFDEESEAYEDTEEQTGVTLANLTPTFTFSDVVAGQEDIVFEYMVTDTDEVGSLTKIELLKGTEVVETLTEFESTMFEGLLSNNDYQLKATYTYDLNDGAGNKLLIKELSVRTNIKDISVTSYNVVSGTIYEGSDILLAINISNPDNVIFKEVVINGEFYTLTTGSTASRLMIELNSGDNVGEWIIVLDSLIFYVNELEISYDNIINSEIELFVYGTVKITDGGLIGADFSNLNENTVIRLLLDNKTNYLLNEIIYTINNSDNKFVISQDEITYVSNNEITFILKGRTLGNNFINISQIKYSLNDVTIKLDYYFGINVYLAVDSTINHVSTINDLVSIETNAYKYYKLINDIDLSSANWNPLVSFYGYLNGNGHSIMNLNLYESNQTNSDYYVQRYGFILNNHGTIRNILFTNVYFFVNSPSGFSLGVVAANNSGNLNNIYVSGNIIAKTTFYMGIGMYGMPAVGGLFGLNSGHVTNSQANLNVNVDGLLRTGLIGGNNSGIVTNNVAYGELLINNIQDAQYGGLIGETWPNGKVYNNISGVKLGGIIIKPVGYSYNPSDSYSNFILLSDDYATNLDISQWNIDYWDFTDTSNPKLLLSKELNL